MPDTPASAPATPATPTAHSAPGGGVHTETEDHPWTIEIGDHPQRADSPEYLRSRNLMIELVKLSQPWFFGGAPYQDHHGGGLWLKTPARWLLVLNTAGMEWSSQFCADPAKVDLLRQGAKLLIDSFPDTVPGYEALGYKEGREILDTPITDAAGVARWTDSIYNASVPLPALAHTGVLPKGGGYHHYPKPIVDIATFKRDDFTLWVTDEQGQPAAVVPMGAPGSGNTNVQVVFATPGTALHAAHQAAHDAGQILTVDGNHSLAQQAFVNQT
ncbi:MAG: hypothetical protein NVSMB32_09340 [Actinomycetota bacterium]